MPPECHRKMQAVRGALNLVYTSDISGLSF